MKQYLFMISFLLLSGFRSISEPFWGVLPYYSFMIIQPQYLWDWSLPAGVRWSFFAAVIAISAVIIHFPSLLREYRMSSVMILSGLFTLMSYLSTLTAMIPWVSQGWWTVVYSKILLMYFVTAAVLRRIDHMLIFFLVFYVSLAYVTYHYNDLYIFEDREDLFYYGHGVFDNNHAGLLLGMCFPLAYIFVASCRRWWAKLGHSVIGMMGVHGIMFSYSRGAMVAGVAAAVWLFLRHRPRRQSSLAIIAFIPALLTLAGPRVRDEFMSIKDHETDASAQTRFDAWASAIEIANDYPITGVGLRNSGYLMHHYGGENRTVHNQFLQVAADSGWIAATVFVGICLVSLLNLESVRRKNLAESSGDPDDLGPDFVMHTKYFTFRVNQNAYCLGLQGAMITFMVGGIFLSLEGFEIFWMIVLLAGQLPTIMALDPEGVALGYEKPEPVSFFKHLIPV